MQCFQGPSNDGDNENDREGGQEDAVAAVRRNKRRTIYNQCGEGGRHVPPFRSGDSFDSGVFSERGIANDSMFEDEPVADASSPSLMWLSSLIS